MPQQGRHTIVRRVATSPRLVHRSPYLLHHNEEFVVQYGRAHITLVVFFIKRIPMDGEELCIHNDNGGAAMFPT